MNRTYSSVSSAIPGHDGRWYRRGNTVVVDLFGAAAPVRQLESELDFESEGESIPLYYYLHWVQLSLNLYFIKKGRPERSPEDGTDSSAYRAAVKLFKSLAGVKPTDDKVDEKTQNALILANESNPGYLAWLRTQFDKVGYAHLTIAYEKHEKPVAVIREFQKDFTGRFGFNLIVDGFMGPKTQLALMHALHSLTPKPKPPEIPKPIEVTDEQLNYKLLLTEQWIRKNRFPQNHPALMCFLHKLRHKAVDDDYFNVENIHGFFGQTSGSKSIANLQDFALSARCVLKSHLQTEWRNNRPVKPEWMVEKVQSLVKTVIAGIRATDIPYCDDLRRPGVQRELKRRSTRSDSLYSCPGIKEVVDGLKGCAK